ncbi:kinase-like domain-containing protein [Mycena crocata]|nr:kinase-like domain-containing protein [Mycena crocata]
MEDTPQSKRQNRSQSVKGDKSCLNCRILRIKCDRVIPICGACLAHPRKDICEYSDGSKESRKDFVAHILMADLLSKVEVRQQNSGNIARSVMAVSHREMSEGSGEHTGSSLRPSILPPCSKCRSRKVLCDGEQPCNNCRTAEISFQCDTRTRLRRASSGNSSDGEASSGLSGFSDGGSDSSRGSYFSSSYTSPQRDWNLPTYDLQSHQLLLNDLDLTGQVIKLDGYPFESGGAADIYRGTLSSPRSGIHQYKQVAVKIFRRMHSDPETLEQTSKSLYEEARVWRQLKHPNVIPFLGISLNLGLSPALISPLCPWGPIMKYFQRNPKDRKEKLQMVIGVANGLAYLHSQGIVHGNLSTVSPDSPAHRIR